jgi:hypothetical protein
MRWNAIEDITDAIGRVVTWRRDWDRTWSPVSYLLFIASAIGLCLLLSLYGAALWARVSAGL